MQLFVYNSLLDTANYIFLKWFHIVEKYLHIKKKIVLLGTVH